MKQVQVKMLKSRDQLEAGSSYLIRADLAEELIRTGYAVGPMEKKPTGPSETKPFFPSELKQQSAEAKKKRA